MDPGLPPVLGVLEEIYTYLVLPPSLVFLYCFFFSLHFYQGIFVVLGGFIVMILNSLKLYIG
jgi:hypothetical protein